MPTVDIILKEKIANLGAEGDVVKVKGGFARNFLIPQGKAYAANKGNLRQLDSLKKVRAEREAKEIEEAEKISTKLKRLKLKLTLATGQAGKLSAPSPPSTSRRPLRERCQSGTRPSPD